MILVDANLLVYAYIKEVPQHTAALAWLETSLSEREQVGIPWASFLAFARIASNRRIFKSPVRVLEAWQQVEEWLDLEPVWIPEPTARHREVLREVLGEAGDDANLVPDAHLAALAIEHDLTLCSADRDFARFAHLRWQNPLTTR